MQIYPFYRKKDKIHKIIFYLLMLQRKVTVHSELARTGNVH